MDDKIGIPAQDILLYSTNDGAIKVDVIFQDESFWLTQKALGELFGVNVPAISKHLGNIFTEGELVKNSVVSKMEITATDGKRYSTTHYNLDAIIAVGYRVNSQQATKFRIWATNTLKEFIIKGFVLDDERLKQGQKFGEDYFDELLDRIRSIRASERRFYQKITDIFAECSADYDASSEISTNFYASVQNKLHWAIHGNTAAELISKRADSDKPHMGLSTWKNAPDGKILKGDVVIAKNYLTEEELRELERIVSMYLDYAINQAEKKRLMKMLDWADKLDAFLEFNDYEVLSNVGRIKADVAKRLAKENYEVFRVRQDQQHKSDFDKLVEQTKKQKS